jgi:Protein of unknown function (DUF3574)
VRSATTKAAQHRRATARGLAGLRQAALSQSCKTVRSCTASIGGMNAHALRPIAALTLAAVLTACAPPRSAATLRCSAQTVSRLYFGLDTPDGPVTDAAWQDFVRAEIAPRLPAGFTLLAARGQWRDDAGVVRQEDSRVLEVVASDGAAERHTLAEIVGRYKTRFRQQSVLVTQSPARACW